MYEKGAARYIVSSMQSVSVSPVFRLFSPRSRMARKTCMETPGLSSGQKSARIQTNERKNAAGVLDFPIRP